MEVPEKLRRTLLKRYMRRMAPTFDAEEFEATEREANKRVEEDVSTILDAFREELLGRVRDILVRRIYRYRSDAAIFKRRGQIDEAVRLERAANVLGSALHEYDASLSTLGDSDG